MVLPFVGCLPAGVRDVSAREGAYSLAREIEKRWAKLGHMVKCRVVESPGTQFGDAMYHVRSDLVAGLPRKMANKLAA